MDVISVVAILVIFGFLVPFLVEYVYKSHAYQMSIAAYGQQKLPRLLLLVAGIKSSKPLSYKDLSKPNQKKMLKHLEKLSEVANVELTFLYNQNLLFVTTSKRSYFSPLDHHQWQILREEIGKIDKSQSLEFVIYRRVRRWPRTPIILGYLHNKYTEDVEIIFEFPEKLVKNSLFVNKKKYGLKKDVVAGMHKNELGDEKSYYFINFQQEHKSGCNWWYQVSN